MNMSLLCTCKVPENRTKEATLHEAQARLGVRLLTSFKESERRRNLVGINKRMKGSAFAISQQNMKGNVTKTRSGSTESSLKINLLTYVETRWLYG